MCNNSDTAITAQFRDPLVVAFAPQQFRAHLMKQYQGIKNLEGDRNNKWVAELSGDGSV